MRHRHLDYEPGTPVDRLGRAALDDLLDHGDLADWTPLAAAILEDPHGTLAETCLTQVQVASRAGMAQSDVSKLERRDDPRLSTLERYVSATGGRLHLVAEYPDVGYEIRP